MGLSAADRKRMRELGGEIRKIMGGAAREDGTPKTFEELERDSIEVGDAISCAMLEANVRDGEQPAGACRCPTCNRLCPRCEEGEPRVLQTDRGEVGWLEAEYFCRRCRRSFFPSDGGIGPARGSDGKCSRGTEVGLRGSLR